jgi:rubrerythrin
MDPNDEGRTLGYLSDLIAREAQTVLRYRFCARAARLEGAQGAAALFDRLAQNQSIIADGHLDFLRNVGDPLTGQPLGSTREYLNAMRASESEEASRLYPAGASLAEAEGYTSVASWLRTLAASKRQNLVRLDEQLAALDDVQAKDKTP